MKTNSPNQGRFLIAFLALAGIAAVLWAISHYSGAVINPYLMAGVRWAAITGPVRLLVFSPLAYAMDICRHAGGRGDRL